MTAGIAERAIATLEANWTGSHTLPSSGLYPHQWSWDSAFIAIGLRHISPRRAGQELDALLAGQWTDGRIPQIIFDPRRDDQYAPGASFWQSRRLPISPEHLDTAGLVQPPNHAWAVWKVHVADPDESRRRRFLERAYPRLLAWHAYLREQRDLGGRGLASIVHPWESGTDNSPLWDEALARVPDTPRHPIERPDLQHAEADERPSDKEYGRFFWLAERYRDGGCVDAVALPFVVEDPLFNTLFAVSEDALGRIAAELGADPAPHRAARAGLRDALGALRVERPDGDWFGARDVIGDVRVEAATVNGLAPLLLDDLPAAERLLATLEGDRFLGAGALPPSYDATAPDHDPAQYWRGPAWFNMAWLLAHGLAVHGNDAAAASVRAAMAREAGAGAFPEYVEPASGRPHGTRRFSWTAALVLDALRAPDAGLFE